MCAVTIKDCIAKRLYEAWYNEFLRLVPHTKFDAWSMLRTGELAQLCWYKVAEEVLKWDAERKAEERKPKIKTPGQRAFEANRLNSLDGAWEQIHQGSRDHWENVARAAIGKDQGTPSPSAPSASPAEQ